MHKIILINMPFGGLAIPSLGLSQIKAVLDQQGIPDLKCEILYLNHDFTEICDTGLYNEIANSLLHHSSGTGDWLFRELAFPDLADNSEQYFRRFLPRDALSLKLKAKLLDIRRRIPAFCEAVIRKYSIDDAHIVGFTSMFQQTVASLAMARILKEKRPSTVTFIGGANCETPMGEVIARNFDCIDYVCSGSGLVSFPKAVNILLGNSSASLEGIPGILRREAVAAASETLAVETDCDGRNRYGEELDINAGIEPDYHGFLDSVAATFPGSQVEPSLAFETSRGCWWGAKSHCTFCGLNSASLVYRAMAPEKARRQFELMYSYSDRCKSFNCVDNIMPRGYLKDVFPHLNPPENISMMCEVKVPMSLAELHILAKAKILAVQPGIEALATSTLRLMKKGTTSFQNLQFLQNCIAAGIAPSWNLLIGFPGEEKSVYEKYSEILPFLSHLPPPTGCYPVRYDRYSVYFADPKSYGLSLIPLDFYSYIYPCASNDLMDLAYYFQDVNMGRATYFEAMMEYYDRIISHIEAWKARWSGGNVLRPQLVAELVETDGMSVLDTRNDASCKHRLGAVAAAVLSALHRPKTIEDIAADLKISSLEQLSMELSALRKIGLIFEDESRYISLVTPSSAA